MILALLTTNALSPSFSYGINKKKKAKPHSSAKKSKTTGKAKRAKVDNDKSSEEIAKSRAVGNAIGLRAEVRKHQLEKYATRTSLRNSLDDSLRRVVGRIKDKKGNYLSLIHI